MHLTTRQQPHRSFQARLQKGITLIESLCAIVIVAIGILGILGVQMRTLTDTQTTVRRAQAIRLIEDLGERMKANPNAISNIDHYVQDWSSGNSVPMTSQAAKKCDIDNCDNGEQATYDIREWKRTVERTLPAGNAFTFVTLADTVTANRRQLGVLIRWRENERVEVDQAYTDAINAGVDRDLASANMLNTETETCPSGYTCHLQYLPVSARCMPDFRGGTTPQFYCAGA
ncbi:MAG: type IV pilus modification protein PilV [Comamonadaceae bacterium]|nr:MAG: type IV pilus modification protein PilV [Comamonadaceae bacterium]